jgi:hypothetical protein
MAGIEANMKGCKGVSPDGLASVYLDLVDRRSVIF